MINLIKKIDNYIYIKLSKYSDIKVIKYLSFFGNIFTIAFIIFLLFILPFKVTRDISIISLFSFVINTIIVFIIKLMVNRKRNKSSESFLQKLDPFSFPSGHVSRLSLFIITSCQLPFLSVFFALITIVVSLSRMIKGYHYFTDCFAGFLLGILTGFLSVFFAFLYLDRVLQFINWVFNNLL